MKHFKKVCVITNLVASLLLAAFAVYLAASWETIPDTVATHFDFSGQADSFGAKGSLIFLPIIAAVICMVLAVAEHFPRSWNIPVKMTEENRERLIDDGIVLFGGLKILLAALFCYVGFCSAKGLTLSWPMLLILAAIAADMILVFLKMRKDR